MKSVKVKQQERLLKKRKRTTLILLVVGGLLLIVAGIPLVKAAWNNKADTNLVEVSGKPSLEVNQELIDFGDVKLNTNLTFQLRLTNVGDQVLEITQAPYIEVREGC